MMEAAHAQQQQNNNKILAIEDDPEVLSLYKTFLQKKGYEVLSASGAFCCIAIRAAKAACLSGLLVESNRAAASVFFANNKASTRSSLSTRVKLLP